MYIKFTVEYIPLSKIKPNVSVKVTERIKKLQHLMLDCMHVMVVRQDSKDSYSVLSGSSRYKYLTEHTNKKYVPCIVESNKTTGILSRLRLRRNVVSKKDPIIRSFLKKEKQFNQLNKYQQVKVLLLGVRYKQTVIAAMRDKVNQYNK